MPNANPTDPDQAPDWKLWLWELLCRVYRVYGGNCDDLPRPKAPATAAEVIQEIFDGQGLPTFATPAARDEFIAILNAIDAHLALADNDLSPDDEGIIQDLLDSLRNALANQQ